MENKNFLRIGQIKEKLNCKCIDFYVLAVYQEYITKNNMPEFMYVLFKVAAVQVINTLVEHIMKMDIESEKPLKKNNEEYKKFISQLSDEQAKMVNILFESEYTDLKKKTIADKMKTTERAVQSLIDEMREKGLIAGLKDLRAKIRTYKL